MRAYTTRLLATLVMMASLLAPFASSWAMALGVADGRLLVICSGDGLRTIYIDENGDATQLSDEAIACVLKSTTDTAEAVVPQGRSDRLLFIAQSERTTALDVKPGAHPAPLPRAPPVI
ncbi:MAG: hypothetical protein AAF382_18015 [Pseudomonadota bacterium]